MTSTMLKNNLIISTEASSNKIYKKFGNLIKATDDLRDVGCNEIINLPKIVVLGTQSSGKSSVLESIIGIDCLPRGDGVVTRRPLELRLIHIPYQEQISPYATFEEIKVKEKIVELTELVAGKNRNIVNIPIKLNIYSNTCPDLTLIDLPGITRIPIFGSDQPQNILEITREMAKSFCMDESTIILCVASANIDITTSEALQMAMELDPNGNRTIGVITKIDLMDAGTNAKKILLGDEVKMKLGFIGLKNRSQDDINKNLSVEVALKREKEFFESHSVYRHMDKSFFGTDNLVERLKSVFMTHLKKYLPKVYLTIKEKIKDCQDNLTSLGIGISSTYNENNKLSFINNLINQYCDQVDRCLSGKITELSDNNVNLQIRTNYVEFLKEFKTNYSPSKLIDKNILTNLLKKSEGVELSGFPSSRVIFILLDNDLIKVSEEVERFYEKIYDLVNDMTTVTLTRILSRFPKLYDQMIEIMARFNTIQYNNVKKLCDDIVAMNFNYLYFDETAFNYEDLLNKLVLNSNQTEDKDQYYENLGAFTKVIIDYYFSVIIRNLREYIPKSWGNFFVKGYKEKLKGFALSEICKLDYDELLAEDPEIARKRDYYSSLYKSLKNSEKIMLSDSEVKSILKDCASDPVKIIEIPSNFSKKNTEIKENVKNVDLISNKKNADLISNKKEIIPNKKENSTNAIKRNSEFSNDLKITLEPGKIVNKEQEVNSEVNIQPGQIANKVQEVNSQINIQPAKIIDKVQQVDPVKIINKLQEIDSQYNIQGMISSNKEIITKTAKYTIENLILKDENLNKNVNETVIIPVKNNISEVNTNNTKGALITKKIFNEEEDKQTSEISKKKTNLFGIIDDKSSTQNLKKNNADPLSMNNQKLNSTKTSAGNDKKIEDPLSMNNRPRGNL